MPSTSTLRRTKLTVTISGDVVNEIEKAIIISIRMIYTLCGFFGFSFESFYSRKFPLI